MYTIKDLYDLDHTLAKDYLEQFTYPWEALKGIKDFILELGPTLGDDYEEVQEHVWIHKTATVFPSDTSARPASSGPRPKFATAHSSAAPRSSVPTASSATPAN